MDLSKAYPDPPRRGGNTQQHGQRGRARPSIYQAALDPGLTARDPAPPARDVAPPGEAPRNGAQRDEARRDGEARPGRRRPRKRRERRQDGEAQRAKQASERLAQAKQVDVVEEGGEYGGKFRQFDLSPEVLRAIDDMGWEAPSEIQQMMIPSVLLGRDVVGQARTGTGKTGAFAIPLVERHRHRAETVGAGRRPAALILSPTRELALQIHRQLEQLAAYTSIRCTAIYGGAPMEPQLRALRAGADIVTGTPGRVMDHMRRGSLPLDDVTCFVLDEADRMFDLGFRDDIYWISRRLGEGERQTLLLSATMDKEVLRLAKEVTSEPEEMYTSKGEDTLTVKSVEQFYVAVDPERKMGLLTHLVEQEDPQKGLVFTRTKRGADKVAERLRKQGFDAGEIHSDLRQKRRESIMERFREGNLHMMVATDVAARGLDIQGVTHIFNFDVPENAEDYVHRVGRTARMGRKGRAFTFITHADGGFLTEIEKLINKEVPRFEIEGYRCEASAEEKSRRETAPSASDHPMASKLSPALLAILNRRNASGPRRGPPRGGGGGRGRPGGGRGGGRGRR